MSDQRSSKDDDITGAAGQNARRRADGSTERDFGDSAGYGGGGSTLDRHDVGDTPTDTDKKPNPLDEVVKTGPGEGE